MIFEALLDVISASRHSRYFHHARSHYLLRRTRAIAILMGILQPAWVFVDFLLLPLDMLQPIAICRVAAGMSCLALALWAQQPYNIRYGYIRLAALVGILSAFQTVSTSLLISHGYDNQIAGYHFFPFMIMTMLAVFPLTIAESAVFVGGVLAIELITQLVRGSFGDVNRLNDLWLLSILGVIAAWAAVNQLNMLLGLYRQATRDPLTGLSNRRQAMEQLTQDIEAYREKQEPISVLMFDLDHFKKFNDTHGHAAGDIVLREFAKIMQKHARKKLDLSGRYGGEEFLMVLPGLTSEQAQQVAEDIIDTCHKTQVETPAGDTIGFTTSIGLATTMGEDSIDKLLKRADDALYDAKSEGRDRVALAA